MNIRIVRNVVFLSLVASTLLFSKGDKENAKNKSTVSSLIKPGAYNLPIVKEKLTLSFAGEDSPGALNSLDENLPVWQEIEKRTNIKIDWQVTKERSAYIKQIGVRLAAGDAPDFFETGDSSDAGKFNIIKLYQNGSIIRTTELIKKYAPNIHRDIKNDFFIRAALTGDDGHLYAVYPKVDGRFKDGVMCRGLHYREDWRRRLGLKEPQTMEEYYELFKAYAEKDPNRDGKIDELPFWANKIDQYSFFGSVYGLELSNTGSKGFHADDSGQIICDFIRPEYKDFLAMMKKFYEAKCLPANLIVTKGINKKAVQLNRAGAWVNGLGMLNGADQVLVKKHKVDLSEGGYTPGRLPKNIYTGKQLLDPQSYVLDRYLVISANCKYPDVVTRYLDFILATEEGQIYTNYGIKDLTYTVDAMGKRRFAEAVTKHPSGRNIGSALKLFGCQAIHLNYMRADAFFTRFEGVEKLEKMPQIAREYNWTNTNVDLPVSLQSVQDVEEYVRYEVDVNTYMDEHFYKFIKGEVPLDYFDKYVDTIKEMGLTKMIEINQKRYNMLKKLRK